MTSHDLAKVAIANPQPGMQFRERLDFWVYVIKREGDLVWWVESSDFIFEPCRNTDWPYVSKKVIGIKRFKKGSIQEFHSTYAYQFNSEHCWIVFVEEPLNDETLAVLQQWVLDLQVRDKMNKPQIIEAVNWLKRLEEIESNIMQLKETHEFHLRDCKHWSTEKQGDPPTGKVDEVCEWCGKVM